MPVIVSEVYEAFRSVGIDDDHAHKAAAALSTHEQRFARVEIDIAGIRTEMTMIRWMIGGMLAVCVAIFGVLVRLALQ